tara:strand:+ start:509 stop:1249 length:741 start_codon:yes stop_codon:yes gene_type:complete
MVKEFGEDLMEKIIKKDAEESTWYYFYSIGCTFCKRIEPIIDELNDEGNDILKLDISHTDNKKLKMELQNEYSKFCGTPWLINADTGNQICGYREKNIILQWLDGKDIPTPPVPTSLYPKVPFHGVSNIEIKKWKKLYEEWVSNNKHLPNLMSADDILLRPRPKSDPPKLPVSDSSEENLKIFKESWNKWMNKNSHLPNLQTADVMINRMKQVKDMQNKDMYTRNLENRISQLEYKVEKLLNDTEI